MKRFNGIALSVAFCSLASQAALAQTKIDTLKVQNLNEVIVKGVRATKEAPYAVANIRKSELKQFSCSGQELPFLLSRTPGILAWSENGIGTGTTYMRIRGAAGSRINVTLDGVALNSPEDQTVFWANMNSYSSLLGSIQIQRGVGSSTNGDGAFGGSISMATAAPSLTPTAEVTGSFGSYNTYHTGASFSTGLLGKHLIFDGAYHETATDGYVDGTAGRSGSYYGGLTWLGDNFKVSYKNIGNFEKTGQAWNGVLGCVCRQTRPLERIDCHAPFYVGRKIPRTYRRLRSYPPGRLFELHVRAPRLPTPRHRLPASGRHGKIRPVARRFVHHVRSQPDSPPVLRKQRLHHRGKTAEKSHATTSDKFQNEETNRLR